MNQQALPVTDLETVEESVVGGNKDLGEGRGLNESHFGGNANQEPVGASHVLGIGGSGNQSHDPVTRFPAFGLSPGFFDFPGKLESRNVLPDPGGWRVKTLTL